ncbi:hypothetical protein F5J12DRAFT_782851 [Pisolithus orientalis]|uniref:uncharacterized protein n=1 Tax=Pisolithus orientalis TaxID=936130 RepID=UPI0022254346|nr:uncharacterized protein F5J12DRAFT_782851 [Pisolithus orientalis]KAI6006594.1 hypothetical protein F5J12DRAFT_782851 [Pisolithus orientalis]
MVSDANYEVVAAIRSIRSHSGCAQEIMGCPVASLAVLLWDSLLMMGDEVHCIWTMKGRPIKWLYFLLRYFPLFAQILHQIVFPDLSGRDTLSPIGCKLWHAYMIILIQVITIALELVLALRVIALFGRHRWVSGLLGCIMAIEILYKQSYLETGGFLRTTIAFQIVRDGTITYFAIMALICCGFIMIRLHWYPATLFFWAVTVHSISGTRLILNMACLRGEELSQESENNMFTTLIDVSANFMPEV